MKLTGTEAAEEYSRRYGLNAEIDRDLSSLLTEGLISFDPETEMFAITEDGRDAFDHDQAERMKLENWDQATALN